MAELTGLQHALLETLSIQSDGYLASPKAAAFAAVGLEDPDQIHEGLVELQELGFAEHYIEEEQVTVLKVERNENGEAVLNNDGTVNPVLDDEGKVQTEVVALPADSGWVITEAGRGALENI